MHTRAYLVACILLAPLAIAADGAEDLDIDLPPGVELRAYFESDSRAWHHIRYDEIVDGIPVLDAGAAVHSLLADPARRVIQPDLVPATPRSGSLAIPQDAAFAIAERAIGSRALQPGHEPSVAPMWVQTPQGLRLAHVVELASLAPAGHFLVAVDGETGDVLLQRETSLHATARVFKDNPIVAKRDPGLRDNALGVDDGSFSALTMDVELRDLTGPRIEGPRIAIMDSAPPRSADRRDDPRMLDAMVYYHVTEALARLDAAGYPDLPDYQIKAYAHQPPVFIFGVFVFPATGPDAYAGNGELHFLYRAPSTSLPGTGSSAEDAEVIDHELGHLIHAAAAPKVHGDFFVTFAEGAADLLSALLTESEAEGYGAACVAEWMSSYYPEDFYAPSAEGLPCIRTLENDLVHPDDAKDEGHWDGMFWSGPLWRVRQEIGNDAALNLTMETLFLIPPEPRGFEDIAKAALLADLGLTGGANEGLLRDAFGAKGIEAPTLLDLQTAGELPSGIVLAAAAPAAEEEARAQTPAAGLLLALAGLAAAGLARRRS